MTKRHIGIVLFPGFQVLNLAATTVFEFANLAVEEPAYRVSLLSESGGGIASSAGFSVETVAFSAEPFDTVLVVGNNYVEPVPPGVIMFLQAAALRSRRIGSTCTGSFILAEAGLLDGRRATTHWYHARAFQRAFPKVKVEEDRIFIIDGSIWTSAGMTSCIDLALALVEKDLGSEIAKSVAKKLVVNHRRAGGQSQYSALLDLDPKSDRIQTCLAYAKANLAKDLSVEHLAEIAHLSPRQFSRIFQAETGQSPAKAIENLRVEAARLMLEHGRIPIDTIAQDVGFGDRERMRRAFLRAFGQPPRFMQRVAKAAAVAV
ncbi:MAG: GlxA family transcriptional regulator [Phyllobacterium sp.]|uniref:GlxA family transcriptional regulator n=1 Tax=Phyllobacterium sp. TaxID=1871046 RepID=UPI0030F29056